MRIAIVADAYLPQRTSAAVQLRDLAKEMLGCGHQPTVLVPWQGANTPWRAEVEDGVNVIRLRAPITKDIGYVRRTVGEFLMPFAMLRNLRKIPAGLSRWDGVVWYSPSIFHGPLVAVLKRASKCRSYLILRDLFPEWAVDMGLMGRGLPYWFFKSIEIYQYTVADVIGVQALGTREYFSGKLGNLSDKVEVLHNWLGEAPDVGCRVAVRDTVLSGRKIFVYAGNMGVAQGAKILLDVAQKLRCRSDLGFLFVGRGSDLNSLRTDAMARGLDNVMFFDEVAPAEIPGLLAQCHVGLVSLDPRHRTHNIPGKFLTYMRAGLPVLASINSGNELGEIIGSERVGRACTNQSAELLTAMALDIVRDIEVDPQIRVRCTELAARVFSPEVAVHQIIEALRT